MQYDQNQRNRARELRKEMNETEKALWGRLRDRRRRFKFRRQHPLGPYTADFWCAVAKVVVEVDGASHAARKEHDRKRDDWMKERGITVLRFTNFAIDDRLPSVLNEIEKVCAEQTDQKTKPVSKPNK